MRRSATLAGPGIARSPSAQRRTVRASTSSAAAASTCDMPSAAIAARNSSADIAGTARDVDAANANSAAGAKNRARHIGQAGANGAELIQRYPLSGGSAGLGGAGDDQVNGALAHASYLGPLVLSVNNQISAAEASRRHGAEGGGGFSLPGAPAARISISSEAAA